MKRKIKALLKKEKGFTLVELLAVIVILGIIAAIAIPSIGNIIANSRIDAVKSDAIQIINAAKTAVAAEGVPADNTLDQTNLSNYVDIESGSFTNYTVTITPGTPASGTTAATPTTYELDGTGENGNNDVVFTDATIADINDAEKGDTSIGQ